MENVVIDTNILVAALKSNKGAAYALIAKLPQQKFVFHLSVPLYLEYQDVLKRPENMTEKNSQEEIQAFLRYVCKMACHQKIFYLWRPWLKDPKDDMVLELAVAAHCKYIITYNLKDFMNVQFFGIQAVTPKEFLSIINEV